MSGTEIPPEPSDAELRERLGPSHAALTALLEAWPGLRPEWKWYGEERGWSLKLLDGKHTLCSVTPDDGRFTVGFILGHDAVERALRSRLPAEVRKAVAGARTSPEGRRARIEVRSTDDLEPVDTLLAIKLEGGSRKGGGRDHAPGSGGGGHGGPGSRGRTPSPDHRAGSQRRGRTPE